VVHKEDMHMSETRICSTAQKHFFLHPRYFSQNNTGPEFVILQENIRAGNYSEKINSF
jgi:hypothetical protein